MNETLSVRNPRTGEMDYTLEATSPAEIAHIAAELTSNQADWNEAGLSARIDVLRSFSGALDRHRGDIVQALSADTGRVAIAKQEVDGLQRSIDRWCKAAPTIIEERERRSEALPHIAIQQRHEPYPLVGAISPWNFPLLLSFIDVTPALLAGCAAMIKPSEVTPRFAEPVTAAIDDVAELRKVLRFVPGDGRTGAELIDHVDAVAFTGSVATGKKVCGRGRRRIHTGVPRTGWQRPGRHTCRVGPRARVDSHPASVRGRYRPGLPVARARLRQ